MQNSIGENLKDIVGQTSGFMPRDINALVADAGANLMPRLGSKIGSVESRNCNIDNAVEFNRIQDGSSSECVAQSLDREYLTKALERSKKRNASALGTPKVRHFIGRVCFCHISYNIIRLPVSCSFYLCILVLPKCKEHHCKFQC